MRQIEFKVPKAPDMSAAETLVERTCAAHGLTVAMKGSLATFSGSVHWHYKQPKQKGTLELTLLPADQRIWAQIHNNRAAAWIDALLPRIQQDIEKALKTAANGSRRRLQ